VKIRDRQPTDLDQCVSALAIVHQSDGYPLKWPTDPCGWLCRPGFLHGWVAETDGAEVVGHVTLQRVTPPIAGNGSPAPATAEVSRLFVVPAARRQAVATGLLEHAQRWAAEHGFDLILEVTDVQGSAAAIALYQQAGWQDRGTTEADWTTRDGRPVMLRHYTRAQDPSDRS
jgi:GNAT superfamily N-acetyltransferase